MRVFLASRHLVGFVGCGRRAAVLPTAAEPLSDRDIIVRDLLADVEADRHREPSPIGLYFAKLWYYEKLYPLIFTVSALGQALRAFLPQPTPEAAAPRYGNR